MNENLAKKMAAVDVWARQMARADMEKAAQVSALVEAGQQAGAAVAKLALDIGAIGKQLGVAGKQLGTGLMSYARREPLRAGLTAAGAVGGALHGGMRRDEQGRSSFSPVGALTGAVGGGTLGHLAGQGVQGIQARQAAGASLADAAKATAARGLESGVNLVNRL